LGVIKQVDQSSGAKKLDYPALLACFNANGCCQVSFARSNVAVKDEILLFTIKVASFRSPTESSAGSLISSKQ